MYWNIRRKILQVNDKAVIVIVKVGTSNVDHVADHLVVDKYCVDGKRNDLTTHSLHPKTAAISGQLFSFLFVH